MTRQSWVDPGDTLSVKRQCELAGVARSTLYARRQERPEAEQDMELSRILDELYTAHPFYGSRRMVLALRQRGYPVNRKRVQRLMRQMGLAGMAPGPLTSRPHPENKVYPYLLRGVAVTRPNQVWSSDITYVRLPRGFVYLTTILDWYSRKVLSWRISNTMDAAFCIDALTEALEHHGAPEIFNSDQGSQYTSKAFIDVLKEHHVAISMDGRGRAFDNIFVERLWRTVKYEDIYLRGYSSINELTLGLTDYFRFYNAERPHQSLEYQTPDQVYCTGIGGGASIPDHFASTREAMADNGHTGQRCAAADQMAEAVA